MPLTLFSLRCCMVVQKEKNYCSLDFSRIARAIFSCSVKSTVARFFLFWSAFSKNSFAESPCKVGILFIGSDIGYKLKTKTQKCNLHQRLVGVTKQR